MTVGGWVLFGVIVFALVIFGLMLGYAIGDWKGAIAGFIVGILIAIFVLIGMRWYYNNTASGKRALKTQESNFKNGLQRTVKVFDVNGSIIYQYDGKIDIEYDECRILFDDEDGKRHVIYYTTGTVLIEETGEEGAEDE